jgi:hypothetical protein
MKFQVLARVGKWVPGQVISLREDFPNLSQFITQGFLKEIKESSPPPSSSTGESEEESTVGASGEKRERKTKRRKR